MDRSKYKVLSYTAKSVSVGATGVMGATTLASIAPYLENSLLIGGALGLGFGAVVATGIDYLERKRQVIPIIGIGWLLANGGYMQGAEYLHQKNLEHELSKTTYSYNEYVDVLKNTTYDSQKYHDALKKEIHGNRKENAGYEVAKKAYESFNVDDYAKNKTNELLDIKYDRNGNRTARYNQLIAPYIELAKKYNIILPPSAKRGTKQDMEAVGAIAMVMAMHEKNRLKSLIPNQKPFSVSDEVKSLSIDSINALREELTKKIEKEVLLASSRVENVESLRDKAFWVGIISEIILAPILLWIELLGDLPNPFKTREKRPAKKNGAIINVSNSFDDKKESINIEVQELKDKLKNNGLKITKRLERILHVSLDVFADELDKMLVITSGKRANNGKEATNIAIFNTVSEKELYETGAYLSKKKNLTDKERKIYQKSKEVKYSILTKKDFMDRGGDRSIYSEKDNVFSKDFGDGVRFLKFLILNFEIKSSSRKEIQEIILEAYKEYK